MQSHGPLNRKVVPGMSATSSRRSRRVASCPSLVAVAVVAGLALAHRASPRRRRSAPARSASLGCTTPGTNPVKPPPPPAHEWVISYKVWSNHIKIYKRR